MSVVGLDIGNENCVIGVVKQGGIDVLLNDESKRETPAVVCFGEKQRFLGSAGAASASMNPRSTISSLKRLVGRNFKEPDVQNELKMLPFETSQGPDGGILIHLTYLGEVQNFTPVQILGMLFAHLKDIAEKNLEKLVSDCVIGIPSYLTDLQRRAYLDAAEIAGLKPLRLMHDCTATALSYGIYKTDFSTSGQTIVVFVDIGHCDTQICVASYIAGHMKILSHAFDANLGGRDFDEVLFHYFTEKFKEHYNIDVYSNVRACLRLRTACEKLKKVLSANAEAPLNVECLMEEKDVKGFIKREEFEKLTSELLYRLSIPCNKALTEAGLSVEKIYAVELVGSGSRIPAITKLLATVFKREPGRTLNASECVARGCALQCAMLSPVFRVREYEVQDCIPFSVGISSDEGPVCKGPNGVLFSKGQSIPSVKILTLQRSKPFNLEAHYAYPNELPSGVSQNISCFTIGSFQSHNKKARVKVKVQLNLHGIVNIESASLIEDERDDIVRRESPSDDSSMMVENGEEDVTSVQPKSSRAADKGQRRLDLPIHKKIYGGTTETELAEAREKELLLAQQDRTMELTKDKKNALESYVYEMRNKLFNTYRSFASDAEKEVISRSLQGTEEWLYEDGDDETENAYTSKLSDLKTLVDPIENRYKNEKARAQATRDLLNSINDYRMHVDSITDKDKELIVEECNKVEQWIREKTHQQESLPKNADPVLWSSEIKSQMEDLNRFYKHILKRNERSQSESPATHDNNGSDYLD